MRPIPFLAGLAVLGLATAPAAADGLSQGPRLAPAAQQQQRDPALYTLAVGQGAGIDLPTVAAQLKGEPMQRYFVLAEANGSDPFLVTGGFLDGTGAADLLLDLPAEVLEVPLVFRAGFLRVNGPVFSGPEPLVFPLQTECFVEDWEDHDCGYGAGCEQGDGDSPSAPGQIVTGQWVDEWGIVYADNDRPAGPDIAVIFDSAAPTGGDTDLGTPLIDGGDGCILNGHDGGAGGPIGPGDPCKAYDHVLIIQENTAGCADGFCDVPDDEGWGGVITLEFRQLVNMCWMDLLDVDDAGGATIRTFCDFCAGDDGDVIWVPPGPDHSLRRVFFSLKCVDRVEVEFSGSGAIAEFGFEFCDIIILPD